MYEHELQKIRQAELLREADGQRLARQARVAYRAARSATRRTGREGTRPVHETRTLRERFARAA